MALNNATAKVDVSGKVGDDMTISINYLNPDKTQIDLSGYTVVVTIESNDNLSPFPIVLTEGSGVTVGGSVTNLVAELTDTQTISMGQGSFSHKWVLTNDGDGSIITKIKGVVTLNV